MATLTIGELAKLAGITVRTLHHYDECGLVQPRDRGANGYRRYGDADVLRLQRVMAYRELGLPLARITAILDDPRHDARAALREQRAALSARRSQLDRIIAALDRALRHHEGDPMAPDDVPTLFAGFDPALHADEAERRWGDTAPYREAAARTRRYGQAEWDAIRREADAIYQRFAALMREGAPPADARARGVVAAHRAHLERWFYAVSDELHRGLGEMYAADARFGATFDAIAPGLATYVRDAIVAAGDEPTRAT